MGADTPQKQYNKDSAYYMGLHAIDDLNEDEALRLFREGRDNCSPLAARRCAEALTLIGNVQDRVDSAVYLINTYHDTSAMLTGCKELYRAGEYAKLLSLTDNIDFKKDPNELIRLRMDSMLQKKDSRLENELYEWLHERPCGSDQNAVYTSYVNKRTEEVEQELELEAKQLADSQAETEEELKYAPEDEKTAAKADIKRIQSSAAAEAKVTAQKKTSLTPKQQIMEYRMDVYRKDFATSYRQMGYILSLCHDSHIPLFPQLISDMGKAALYGTETQDVAARRFNNLANQIAHDASLDDAARRNNGYYAHFYAARCYDKDGNSTDKAKEHFAAAMELAEDDVQYDNSLWYMLNADIRLSNDDAVATLKKYAATWHDPAYFDDIFDSLSVQLISHQDWQSVVTVWQAIDGHATDETCAKFAYLSGRLLEEHLADPDDDTTRAKEINAAFTRALSSGSDYYYKLLAAQRLDLSKDELKKILLTTGTPAEKKVDESAEILLGGYAAFGFPQKIYSEWAQNRTNLSTEAEEDAAKFLQQCGISENRYIVQGLRIAARAITDAGTFSQNMLELNYPRFFSDSVKAACSENTVPEYEMFALIRSESYFDTGVVSHAGAAGLTQLMTTTAAEVAKKLNVSTYDMNDANTNIRFGSYYLNDLTSRLNGSPLLALFAYNAGLTHVRGWMKASADEYAKTGKPMHRGTGISTDLFLETLPFPETREYGRKLISSAAMYGWLYYGKSTNDIVSEMLK